MWACSAVVFLVLSLALGVLVGPVLHIERAIARVLPALDSGGRTADVELGASVTDLKLAAELGKRCSAPMLVANLVCSTFEGAANVLGNDATIDAMSRLYEVAAGVTFRQPAK